MSAAQVAAIVGAIAGVALVGIVAWVAVSLRSTLNEVKGAVVDVRREIVPLLVESRETVHSANADLTKVGDILDTANSVTGTVDSASKFAYSVFSNPLIKTAALGTGIASGVKSMRKKGK